MAIKTVKRFNGNTIQNGSFRAALISASAPNAKNVYIEQAQADSQDSGAYTVDVRSLALAIEVVDYANRYALEDQLQIMFKRGTRGDLEATFHDEALDYLLPCTVINITQDKDFPQFWTVLLQTGATNWRSVSAATDTWTPSGTSDTKAITVLGKDTTRLSLTITPTVGPASGYLFQDLYQLVNVPLIDYGRLTWCLQLDTAAIVTATHMQASCNDLRIWLGETETKRWIDSPNTTTTKLWFSVEMKPGFDLTLLTAVAGSGDVAYLQFPADKTTQGKLAAMAATGIVYHGTEWFLYSSRDATLCRLYISKRTFLGTAIQSHLAGVTFKYIGKPITITYGNSVVGDPAADDDHYDDDKPVFNLNLSDNTKWAWTAADKFYDPEHPNRPGSWKPFLKKNGDKTETYTFTENGESGAPVLGIDVFAYLKANVWTGDVVTGGWQFDWPGGFSKVTMTGKKLRSGTQWGTSVGLQRSDTGKTWIFVVATEPTPTTAGAYSTFAHTDKVIPNTTKSLRIGSFGSCKPENSAHMQIEGLTAIAYFASANIPTGTLLGAKNNITLDVTLSNAESGDSVRVVSPMLLDKVLAINGETNVITFDGINAHGAITLNDDSRSEILRLVPGVNHLNIISADMGTLEIVPSWYSRRP